MLKLYLIGGKNCYYAGGSSVKELILELREEDEDFFAFSEEELEEILNYINN